MIHPNTSVRDSYSFAWRLYWKAGFWSYSLLCFIVGTLALLLLTALAGWVIIPVTEVWIEKSTGLSGWWITLLAWLVFSGVLFILLKPVMLLAMGPVLQRVSDEVEKQLTMRAPGSSRKPAFTRGLYNAVKLGLRNTIIELIIQGMLLLLGLFIPFLGGIVGTIAGTVVSAYFWGFSTLDFVLEGKGFNNRQKILFIRSYRQETSMVGLAFLLLFLIPVAGLFLAPVLGVMASTILANGLLLKNPDSNPFASRQTHSRM